MNAKTLLLTVALIATPFLLGSIRSKKSKSVSSNHQAIQIIHQDLIYKSKSDEISSNLKLFLIDSLETQTPNQITHLRTKARYFEKTLERYLDEAKLAYDKTQLGDTYIKFLRKKNKCNKKQANIIRNEQINLINEDINLFTETQNYIKSYLSRISDYIQLYEVLERKRIQEQERVKQEALLAQKQKEYNDSIAEIPSIIAERVDTYLKGKANFAKDVQKLKNTIVVYKRIYDMSFEEAVARVRRNYMEAPGVINELSDNAEKYNQLKEIAETEISILNSYMEHAKTTQAKHLKARIKELEDYNALIEKFLSMETPIVVKLAQAMQYRY